MDTRLVAREKQLESWAFLIRECKNSGMEHLQFVKNRVQLALQLLKKRGDYKNGRKRWTRKKRTEQTEGEQKGTGLDKYRLCEKIILILILACPITIFIAFVILDVEKVALYSEASLLSTGITIIGFAITVWTGLNIANSINRKELEQIEDKTKKAEIKIGELKNTSEKQLQEWHVESVKIKESVKESLNNYNMLFYRNY